MGPRLKDVEDRESGSGAGSRRSGFNGATSQGRGRPLNLLTAAFPPTKLQWGHVSRTWKTPVALVVIRNDEELQWGHVSRTWKTTSSAIATRWLRSASMGPRLKDVEDH